MVEWKLNVYTICHGVLKIAPQAFVRGFFRSLLDRETWLHPLLMDDALGPDERPGLIVVIGDKAGDVSDQLLNATERSSLERAAGQDREPDLDLVQPRSVRRGIMEMDVGMPRQPKISLRLVRGQVIDHHVDFLALV